jgi:hypothetical protein
MNSRAGPTPVLPPLSNPRGGVGPTERPESSPRVPHVPSRHIGWLIPFLGLIAAQAWLTLGLFGADHTLDPVLDDRPILSGRHPLHLYHGYLGARAFRERGTLSVYDPAFQAGYPKTPVFDSGSRPAEVSLTLAGGAFSPVAYKISLGVLCLLVPIALYLASRAAGLPRGTACLAALLAMLIWWGRPGRDALEAGDVALLLAALAAVVQSGFLIRYHYTPGLIGFVGVVGASLVGWFAHPPLLAALLPFGLVHYISSSCRHKLAWHVPLLSGLALAIGVNAFWLIDWFYYWWIRVPLALEMPVLSHRTLRTLWEAPLWGGPADRILIAALLLLAGVGVVLFSGHGRRTCGRLFGLTTLGLLGLAITGIATEAVGRFGTLYLLLPGLLFAVIPAAHALSFGLGGLYRIFRAPLPVLTLVVLSMTGVWALFPVSVRDWAEQYHQPRPLEIGLNTERSHILDVLREQTTSEARILWEDHHLGRTESRWTALLPLLTERIFVGGLDPEAGIEHTLEGLVNEELAGRPIREWSDDELAEYCRRYNVSWVVCWTPVARERFGRWPLATPSATLTDAGGAEGTLFRLNRRPSFALTGSATLSSADAGHILLSHAVPVRLPGDDEGQIVLSLHYQTGMQVTPSRVRLEKSVGHQDTIPFVRLRVSDEVGLIMITWPGR